MNFPTSQTPPPPGPYPSAPPTMAPEPSGPGLSEPQRLMNALVAPRKTFEDVKRNASWWAPWLLGAIVGLIFAVLAMQKIDMGHFVQQQNDRSPSTQRRLERLTPEQRAAGIEIQKTITKGIFYALPVISLIRGLVVAAVLLFIFNFVLGAEVPFARAMAVVFYAYLPFVVIYSILLIISLLVSGDPNAIDLANPMPTNPGFFMDPLGNQFIFTFASALDIFNIWTIVLLGLGFSTASSNRKPSAGTGILTVAVVYAIVVFCSASWKALA
jgi:Yip1-like protein